MFQTLVLGMIGTDEILLPFDEPPVLWRNKKEITAKQEVAKTSWLYGMLFPARRIHLLPNETGERVSDVYLSQGLNYVVTNVWKDPHVPYRTTDKGRFNWKPNDDETIWRNLTYLLDEKDTPQIVEQRKHLNLDEETIHLVLYGVQTNKASYLRQQRHDLRLPVQLIGNEPAERFIHRYIERAEQLGKALYLSLNQEEISKETRVEAQQRFYGVCEQILWAILDTISQPGADLNELFQQKREEMIREVLAQADRVLEDQTLRGRTILASGEKWKSLWKECEKIRKEDAR
ncbi:MAG: type I-E CRISPR-associated protein Cse1/CasA [Evtepia sp.]